MAGVKRTNLSEILQAVEDLLVAEEVVPDASHVRWLARDDDPDHLAGELDLLLRYGARVPLSLKEQGGGRFGATLEGRVEVYVRNAYSVDQAGTDKEWIKKNDALIDTLLDLLWQFHPEDAEQNVLTVEAFRLTQVQPPRRHRDKKQWGKCACALAFEFLPKIDEQRYLGFPG